MRSEIEARARFEEWRKTLQARPDLSRDGEYYEDHDTQVAWSGYQAALASQGEQVAGGAVTAYIGMPVGERTVARAVASLDQSLTFAQDFRAEDVRIVLAALAARQPVGQKPVCSIDPRHLFLMKGRDGTLSGNVLRFGASMQPGDAALYTAPPQAPAAAVLQESELRVIESLLGLAYEAWNLADNTEDAGDTDLSVQRADFDSLSARLDELDELPDDQPGYTMEAAAKARWALRRVLAAAPVPEVDRAADG